MNQALKFLAGAAVAVAVTAAVTQARSQISPFENPGPWVVRVDITAEAIGGFLQSDDTFDNRERCEAYVGSPDFAAVLTRIWTGMRLAHGNDLKLTNIRCENIGRPA